MAMNALSLAYPIACATAVTEAPSASRARAASRRHCVRQRPNGRPVSARNSRASVRPLAPTRPAQSSMDKEQAGSASSSRAIGASRRSRGMGRCSGAAGAAASSSSSVSTMRAWPASSAASADHCVTRRISSRNKGFTSRIIGSAGKPG